MGSNNKLFVGNLLVAGLAMYWVYPLLATPHVPKVAEQWWGPGKPAKDDTTIRPMKINVPEEVLEDLHRRLTTALPFQESLEGQNQNYGMNSNLLKRIVQFWKSKYDWRRREKYFNKFSHFKTKIQGLDVHFMHVKPTESKGLKVLPILLLHGWPGSIREFLEIIPFLTTPQKGRDFVFEVVVPSLPGYGFSDAAVRPGLTPTAIGVIFKNLMSRLGFDKFYVQGGDWGSFIAQMMAIMYPEKIIGEHLNFCVVGTPITAIKLLLASIHPSFFMKAEHVNLTYPVLDKTFFFALEFGYAHLQATKPDTVGAALRESPVGLAAYIIEKFTTWTNRDWKNLEDGGLTKKFTYTGLLDNVMLYWVNRCITTSMRLYSEMLSKEYLGQKWLMFPIKVPTGCLRGKNDIIFPPEFILGDRFKKLVHLEDYGVGHFAAFEEPEVVAKDIYIFVDKVEKLRKESKL